MAVKSKFSPTLKDDTGIAIKDKPEYSNNSTSGVVKPTTSTTSTPKTNNNTYNTYADLLSKYNTDKSSISSDSSLADNQTESLNQKISATTDLLDAYKNNSLDTQSAKAQSELAQQNASSATKAYMDSVGLGGQGVSESSQVALNNNYANTQNSINLAQNQNNASARDTYNDIISNIDLQEQSNNKDTQLTNYQSLANGMASSVGADGSINVDILNTYKEQADKMLSSGEITQSAYNDILATYQQAVSDYDTANNQTTSAVNTVLGALGVTDYTPITNGYTELSKGNTDTLKSYLMNNYDFSSNEALQRSLNALLSAEEGAVVEIEDSDNGVASFAYVNGKFYKVGTSGSKLNVGSGSGDNNSPYNYASVSDVQEAIKSGAIKAGDYVIYKTRDGRIIKALYTTSGNLQQVE